MKNTVDAIIKTLNEEAEQYSDKYLAKLPPSMHEVARSMIVASYMAGGSSVLQKEISDRLIEKFAENDKKSKHNYKLKTAYKKVPAK